MESEDLGKISSAEKGATGYVNTYFNETYKIYIIGTYGGRGNVCLLLGRWNRGCKRHYADADYELGSNRLDMSFGSAV